MYADGTAIELAPVKYCDVRVQDCDSNADARQHLRVRPGKPVQLSVPIDVAESPWVVSVWSTADLETPQQEFFGPDKAFAYTARPRDERDRILEIQVLQLGAAGNTSGDLIARGHWQLTFGAR